MSGNAPSYRDQLNLSIGEPDGVADGGAGVEPRLPPWWLEQALAAEGNPEPAPALEGDAEADVAIVGGGYTGLWTGLVLRERLPGARVAVLEAEICGAGPSGRNGGFLNGWWPALPELRRLVGDEGALEVARAGARIVPAVRDFCERRGEDVWLREGGELKVSAAPAQDRAGAEPGAAARAPRGGGGARPATPARGRGALRPAR